MSIVVLEKEEGVINVDFKKIKENRDRQKTFQELLSTIDLTPLEPENIQYHEEITLFQTIEKDDCEN
tara:strand:- start:1810 stop:2010 length:201 start_codon:yes stop_codon:yes gene_type:complete